MWRVESIAIRSVGGGTMAGAGADGVEAAGVTDGGFIKPALVRDAIRSLPNCGVVAAAAWFWMLWSCA